MMMQQIWEQKPFFFEDNVPSKRVKGIKEMLSFFSTVFIEQLKLILWEIHNWSFLYFHERPKVIIGKYWKAFENYFCIMYAMKLPITFFNPN